MVGLPLRRIGEGFLCTSLGPPGLMVKRLMGSFPFPFTIAFFLLPLVLNLVGVGSGSVVEQPNGQHASGQPAENPSLPKAPVLPDLPEPDRPPLLPAGPPAVGRSFFHSRLACEVCGAGGKVT
eukprot:13205949-Heterocapsa_arctica.AAC.1